MVIFLLSFLLGTRFIVTMNWIMFPVLSIAVILTIIVEISSDNVQLLENPENFRTFAQWNHMKKKHSQITSPQCRNDQIIMDEIIKNARWSMQTVYDKCMKLNVKNSTEFIGKFCLSTISLPSQSEDGSFQTLKENQLAPDIVHKFDSMEGVNLIMALVTERLKYREIDRIKFPTILPLPVCYPDSCSGYDIENDLIDYVRMVFPNQDVDVYVEEEDCITAVSRSQLRPEDWAFIAFVIFLVVIISLSTVYDYYKKKKMQEEPNPVLIVFSWYSHLSRFLSVSKAKEFPALDGIRTLSMFWIVLGHHFIHFVTTVPCINSQAFIDWTQTLSSRFISGAPFSVETFFFLGGFLLMRGYMKTREKKITFNVPMFYLARYLRLGPALFATMFFVLTVYRYMGSGPTYVLTADRGSDSCRLYWWTTLLYIQNYWNPKEMCIPQSWYLQVDMQLNWIAPFILLPLTYLPRLAWIIIGLLVVVFCSIPFYLFVHYDFQLDALQALPIVNIEYMEKYYTTTYGRAAPWILGLALGYLMFHNREKRKLGKKLVVFIWIVAMVLMPTTLFLGYPFTVIDSTLGSVPSGLYVSCSTVAWCLSLGWVMYACINGYGGFINTFLSLPFFQVLSRCTYSMYLLHGIILSMKFASNRTIDYFSLCNIIYSYWGTLIYTIFFSIIWMLVFEMPMMSIIALMTTKNPKVIESKQEQNNVKDEDDDFESITLPPQTSFDSENKTDCSNNNNITTITVEKAQISFSHVN